MTIEQAIARLKAYRDDALASTTIATHEVGEELHQSLQRRLSFGFQTVPTYLRDPLRIRTFPPGTPAYFSRKSASIGRSPWVGQAQLYIKGQHLLRNELGTSFSFNGRQAIAEIGYRGVPPRYVIWVLFGTMKMQARPFLQVALRDFRMSFVDRVFQANEAAIRAI
jgi:hypothetical protein